MKPNIIHSIAVCLTALALPLMMACSSLEESVEPESIVGRLYLNISTVGQSRAGGETLLDNEKMKSLRVVVLHADGTIEHNQKYPLSDSEEETKRISLKLTPNEKKKIFLFANEESVTEVESQQGDDIPQAGTSLTSFFNNYPAGTENFENAIGNLYFAPDYSEGKAIPMSSMYEIDMTEGNVEKKFYVVRIASKFTVNIDNRRDSEVKLNSFTISRHADKNFLMARVNDSEQNRELFNGKNWIEWLKTVSDASSVTDNQTSVWLKDYDLPEAADLEKTYVNGEIIVGAWSLNSSTANKWNSVFYLPESKNLKPGATDGEQEYIMQVDIDGVSESFNLTLPMKALFRNTHVVINITMLTDEIRFKIAVEPWSFGGRTEIDTIIEAEQ